MRGFCEADVLRALDAGKSTYDSAGAVRCVSAVRAVQCDCDAAGDSEAIVDACHQAVAGTIPDGGDCSGFALSCAEG